MARPVLAPYVTSIRRNRLRARYKGKLVRARKRGCVSRTGAIFFIV